jgi:serine/threonine protein kinase
VLHRDIKPENLLINTHDVVKLSDFGYSVYSPHDIRKSFCGTLAYLSPEMLEGAVYGSSVDIWGLGVLCYELLSG